MFCAQVCARVFLKVWSASQFVVSSWSWVHVLSIEEGAEEASFFPVKLPSSDGSDDCLSNKNNAEHCDSDARICQGQSRSTVFFINRFARWTHVRKWRFCCNPKMEYPWWKETMKWLQWTSGWDVTATGNWSSGRDSEVFFYCFASVALHLLCCLYSPKATTRESWCVRETWKV